MGLDATETQADHFNHNNENIIANDDEQNNLPPPRHKQYENEE